MKQDRRVKYTRMVLRDGLLTLMKDKPIDKITVKEICEKADVNRSTFYVHFASPQDLLDSIKNEMYDEVMASKSDFTDMHAFITQVCAVFYNYRELLQIIVGSIENIGFIYRLCEVWKDDLMRELKEHGNLSDERAEICYLFISSGACAVVVSWALGEFQRTPEEIASELYRLGSSGLGGYYMEGK